MHRFEGFVRDRRSDLRRISNATQGEMEVDDLVSEAWLLAEEIADRSGEPFDFSNPAHQEQLLSWMGARFVKFADKTVRYAIKLDRGWDDAEDLSAGAALAKALSGPESDDPLVRALSFDRAEEMMAAVRGSYSQAAAYVILLSRVEWEIGDLADLLWVGRDTARRRLGRSVETLSAQPSCFDGVDEIPTDFQPWQRRWPSGGRSANPEGQFMFWPPEGPLLTHCDSPPSNDTQ
jgi:hypothetical protein